jgi:hypothetical protein
LKSIWYIISITFVTQIYLSMDIMIKLTAPR